MHTTSATLLERLRQPGARDAWSRFVDLYTPLLYHWARQVGLQEADAADLVQDVLTVLVQKLPEFEYDRHRSFRAWLRAVTLNRWRNRRRRPAPAALEEGGAGLADPAAEEDLRAFEEDEYRRYVVRRALQVMRAEFQPATWQAFWEHTVTGAGAAEVAARLGLSVDAVYAAKSRVLRRLRQELHGLLD